MAGPGRAASCLLPLGALLSACGSGAASPQTSQFDRSRAGDSTLIAFVGVTVVPMDAERRLRAHSVVVADGRIQAIGPEGSVPIPESATVVEGTGRFLMPGLTDAHVHPWYEEDLLPYVANGVTTVVHMGGRGEALSLEWNAQTRRGERIAPHIWVGAMVDGPGGIMPPSRTIADADEARALVRAIEVQGLHFIKAYNSIPLTAFEALVDEATGRGISVASHGVRSAGMDGVLAAGVGLIAHGEEYIYTHFGNTTDRSLMPSAVELTRSAGAHVTPNLSTFGIISEQWGNAAQVERLLASDEVRYLDPRWEDRWRNRNQYVGRTGSIAARVTFLMELTQALNSAGVPLLLGTDSPGIPGLFPGFSIHDDLGALVASGLTPYEALVAGTRSAGDFVARFFPDADPVGVVDVGRRADLLLLAGDPLVDIDHLRRPLGVVLGGRWLPEARLQLAMEELAAALR